MCITQLFELFYPLWHYLESLMAKKRDEAEYARQALRSIRNDFEGLSIFGRPRSIAVYNYVAAAEFDALLSSAADPASGLHASHRRMVESSARVIPKIFNRCDNSPVDDADLREDSYFEEGDQAYHFGYKFDSVVYAYDLANRGQFHIYVAKIQPRISFAYAAGEADRSDTHLRAAEALALASPKGRSPLDGVDGLLKELRPLVRAVKRVSCEYDYSDALIRIASRYGREKLARTNRLELPEESRVRNVTVRDWRAFWAAMMALSEIHIAAHWIGDDGLLNDLPLNTIVLCKPLEEFVNLLSRTSALPDEVIKEMLEVFTYDPAVAADVPILQPFLPLCDGRLCLPSSFVNGNNFERNFRKLLHRHPRLREFADDFVEGLEPVALESLSRLFPAPCYRTRPQVEIPGVTDIDLLVIENNFVLAIQHKWLIGPDALKESMSNDDKLVEGVTQATNSCEYLRNNPEFLRAQLALAKHHEINRVEGVVVCRGLEGTGFLERDPRIPIVTETAFVELMAGTNDLPTLWGQLTARPDHRRAAARAADIKTEVALGDYQFVLPGLAVLMG